MAEREMTLSGRQRRKSCVMVDSTYLSTIVIVLMQVGLTPSSSWHIFRSPSSCTRVNVESPSMRALAMRQVTAKTIGLVTCWSGVWKLCCRKLIASAVTASDVVLRDAFSHAKIR